MAGIGSGNNRGWVPRTRRPVATLVRNARLAKSRRRLKERCDELESQLDEYRAQIRQIEVESDGIRRLNDDFETRLRRAQSDLLRAHSDAQRAKRLNADREKRAAEDAQIKAATRIMTLADDFTNAIEVADDQEMDPKWFDGFKAMAEKVDNCLMALGYRRFESVGEDMDPSRHEALATMPSSDESVGKVVQVIEAGYEDLETSKVVRVAKVLVGAPSQQTADD